MPKSPWKTFAETDPEREYLVLASSIPPKRVSAAPRMFRGASAVRRQLADAKGLIGFSLLAKPFAKQYATLSVWEDEAALDAFVHENPHEALMGSLGADMGETRFVKWHVKGSDARPSWKEALERLR